MSCAEIRWWICELRRRGWKARTLARTLGMPRTNWRKADGKEWIYPTEQIRYSRQLRKIISGELVQAPRRLKGEPNQTWARRHDRDSVKMFDAVLATNPQPLLVPRHLRYNMKTRRIEVLEDEVPENPLPNFKKLLENPPVGGRSCP